jgi:hypothetical protein
VQPPPPVAIEGGRLRRQRRELRGASADARLIRAALRGLRLVRRGRRHRRLTRAALVGGISRVERGVRLNELVGLTPGRRGGGRLGRRSHGRTGRGRDAGSGPEAANEVVAGAERAVGKRRNHVVGRMSVVERRDQRLDDRDGPVLGSDVAPRFEEMRLRNVPVRQRGGLVVVEPEVCPQRDALHRVGEIQIGGRGVDRIAAEHEQEADRSGVHLPDELLEGRQLIRRTDFGRLRVDDGRPDVAERIVHRVRERVHDRRLRVAGDDEAAAAGGLQVFHERSDPCARGVGDGAAAGARDAELRRNRAGDAFDLRGTEGEPVVRAGTGVGRRALDRIEPVELGAVALDAPPRRERARVLQAAVAGAEKVGVEREDDVRALDGVLRIDVLAECEPAALPGVVAPEWLPLHPLGLRQPAEQLVHLRAQRGRGDGLAEDTEARPLHRLLRRDDAAHRGDEGVESPDVAKVRDRRRAIRVVEVEDRGLREDVGGAAARGMIRVAFDLRRAALVALHEEADARSRKRHRRRVEERLAGDELLGLAHVRHDLLARLPRARADAGKRERRAHQLEEAAPADRVQPLRRVLRKFAVQELLELGRLGDRFEAAPVLAPAGRFQLVAKRRQVVVFSHVRITGGTSNS